MTAPALERPRADARAWPAASPVVIAFAAGLVALALRLAWMPGFGGTDDVVYATRGLEIAAGLWRPGTHIGEMRYGINLPIALFARLFGRSDVALTLWSLASSAFEVALVAWFAATFWGRRAAVAAAALLAVAPMHLILGGRTLADAPLGMLITLAFVAFAAAEHSHRRATYIVAGLAAGACWWIKPTVAVPLYFALALYPLALWRWNGRWGWFALGAALPVAAEPAFLGLAFGDPLYTLKALFPFLAHHREYTGDPMWGSNSPWFYFERMFVDGRDLALLPPLAVAGALLAVRDRWKSGRLDDATRHVLYWAAALIGVFSFFVFSLHPLRFIPKQENYESIFVAPLALLGGLALARLRAPARWGWLALAAVAGLGLAGIEQQALRQKASRLQQAAEFALAQAGTPVLMSGQTVSYARMRELAGRLPALPNALPLRELDATARRLGAAAALADPASPALYLVDEPSTPERSDVTLAPRIERLLRCGRPVARFEPQAGGGGTVALAGAGWLRSRLPGVLARRLGFVDPLLAPPAARAVAVPSKCLAAEAGDAR